MLNHGKSLFFFLLFLNFLRLHFKILSKIGSRKASVSHHFHIYYIIFCSVFLLNSFESSSSAHCQRIYILCLGLLGLLGFFGLSWSLAVEFSVQLSGLKHPRLPGSQFLASAASSSSSSSSSACFLFAFLGFSCVDSAWCQCQALSSLGDVR